VIDTTMFILQLIGLAVILFWAITNDHPGGENSGLLAMRGASVLGKNHHQKNARRRDTSGLMAKPRPARRPVPWQVRQKPRPERRIRESDRQ
jgi:hypothetical protein